MHHRRLRRKLILALTVSAMCLGLAYAAPTYAHEGGYKIYDIFYKYIYVPNVRRHGQLSYRHAKEVRVKVVKNFYSRKCYAICHGYVKNFSRRDQKYYNIGLIPPYLCRHCKFVRDVYSVSYEGWFKGKCRGIAWGYLKRGHYKHGYYGDHDQD